ncbi:hypothetical protein BraRD5C2_21720 [Bradyrhizobium sp. RD5-C2]|nr:hypothetical protein BraRD5C2_21720 [Bradyrhizobium sp. RD5-C2]
MLGRYLSADLPIWPGWRAIGIEGPMTGCVDPVAVHANPRERNVYARRHLGGLRKHKAKLLQSLLDAHRSRLSILLFG